MSDEDYRSLSTKEDPQDPSVSITDRPFKTKTTLYGVRLFMVLWTCLGLVVAISHHLLGRYLNGRPAQERLPFGNKYFTYQQTVDSAGNIMALVVNTSFQAAIGLLFVQQFWFQIRRRSFSVKEIDAIMAVNGSPISFSAFTVIRAATGLFTIALIALSMSIIPVVAPGSLTVAQTNFTQQGNCEVPQIQLQYPSVLSNHVTSFTTNLANTSLPTIRDLAGVVLLLRSYLPPTSPCGQCKYNIAINAPAIQCQNKSSSSNMGSMTTYDYGGTAASVAASAPPIVRRAANELLGRDLTTPPSDGGGHYNGPASGQTVLSSNLVWNATYSLNASGLLLLASWRSGDFKHNNFSSQIGETACFAYNATYHADVVHGISSATMNVTSVDVHNNLTMPVNANSQDNTFNETVSMFALVDALASQIQGVLSFDPSGNALIQTSMASYTLGSINDGYWDWVADPYRAIPVMMQNLALSMLARNLGSDPRQSTVRNTTQECWLSPLTFHYDQLRLTGTYASGAFVTILCVLAGFWLVEQNAIDESFNLSRWMDGLVHQEMLFRVQSGELSEDTPLHLRKDGRLADQHIKGSP